MKLLRSLLTGKTELDVVRLDIERRQAAARKYSQPVAAHREQLEAARSAFFQDPTTERFTRWLQREVERDAIARMAQEISMQTTEIRRAAVLAAVPAIEKALTDVLEALKRKREEIVAQDVAETEQYGLDVTRASLLDAIDREIARVEARKVEIHVSPESAFNTALEFSKSAA